MSFAVAFGLVCTTVADVLLLSGGDVDRPGRVAWAVTLTVPVALAVASQERRPILLVPAALLAIGLSLTLFTGLPLLFLPGVAYVIAFWRSSAAGTFGVREVIAIGAPIALTTLAFALLFAGPHTQRCVETAYGGTCETLVAGGSSARLALVIAFAVLALVSGMVAAVPSPRRQE